MSKLFPPQQVVHQLPGTDGLTHVSAFLGAALERAFGVPAALHQPPAPAVMSLARGPRRADIAKCAGDHLVSCGTCLRRLALDAGSAQQWTAPAIKDGACALYASRERYGALYDAGK